MTTPQLLAQVMGDDTTGSHRCFWCGSPAKRDWSPPDTFVNWGDVRCPESRHICAGCVRATDESDRSRRPRMLSWIISSAGVQSLTKAAINVLRAACLNPPKPPFSVVLAVSGQKHLIYRAPVNYRTDLVVVQLELEQIAFTPSLLMDRINLVSRICAATGKPALIEPPSASMTTRLAMYYETFEPLLVWNQLWTEPLSRLAAFLCPNREVCQHEHPSDRTVAQNTADIRRRIVSAEVGRTDGPGLFG